MKEKRSSLFWGLFLLILGGFFLAFNMEVIPELSLNVWAILFGLVGLGFLVGYLVSDVRNWGLLFPAAGCAAVALTIWLSEANAAGELIGGLFMLIISFPFWVAFLLNRRENWWALIPGWATAAIGAVVLFSNQVAGEVVGAFVMFAIGLPFFVVYLVRREHWWALIPGGIMTAIGVIVLVSAAVQDELLASVILVVIGLPFLAVYLSNRDQNWWSLIPAGVLFSIAMALFWANVDVTEKVRGRYLAGTLLAGIAATFAVLWLLRHRHPTEWAKYPAAAVGLAALLTLILAEPFTNLAGPAVLILLGLWMLLRSRRPKFKS